MKAIDLIKAEKPSLSLEVFPPKTGAKFESIKEACDKVGALKPDFMSVTYGAGGGTSEFTIDIASSLQKKYNMPVLAHLSCISSDRAGVRAQLDKMKAAGIENILALRGDIPEDAAPRDTWDYHYASELVAEIKEYGGFCIGGACYPESHPESANQKEDIKALKAKVDAGCEFLTTQMFFDNAIFWNFLYKIREAGVDVPIVAGIMPITKAKQVERAVKLSGTQVPSRFKYMVDHFGSDDEAMRQAGIIYASEQIVDLLANGVPAIHIYTMNDATIAEGIMNNISKLLK